MKGNTEKIQALFDAQLMVVNIGPKLFGDALVKQNVEVIQVDWRPPAGGDKKMQDILASIGGI
jgi:FdrA protein